MSQIQNLIDKGIFKRIKLFLHFYFKIEKNLNFLIKNYDNIPQTYELLKQKLKIILENSDFLDKVAGDLKKINSNKEYLDFVLIFLLKGNMQNFRNLLDSTYRMKEDFEFLEERYKRILGNNENFISDINSYLLSLDYRISQKEKK